MAKDGEMRSGDGVCRCLCRGRIAANMSSASSKLRLGADTRGERVRVSARCVSGIARRKVAGRTSTAASIVDGGTMSDPHFDDVEWAVLGELSDTMGRLYCQLGELSYEDFLAALDEISNRLGQRLVGRPEALRVLARRIAQGRHMAAFEAGRPWEECCERLHAVAALGWDPAVDLVSETGMFARLCLAQRDRPGAIEAALREVESALASLPRSIRRKDSMLLRKLYRQLRAVAPDGDVK
jgi:hypothetical protein